MKKLIISFCLMSFLAVAGYAQTVKVGEKAPDFTAQNIDGKMITLSSLQGKYVVLDFWGSWCGWCIKGFPDMKTAYAKHKPKVEIIGIACGDSVEKWKAATKKHELPWISVLNPSDGDLTKVYGVKAFPTKIVIDPQGKVLKAVRGEDPAFYTYLDEIL